MRQAAVIFVPHRFQIKFMVFPQRNSKARNPLVFKFPSITGIPVREILIGEIFLSTRSDWRNIPRWYLHALILNLMWAPMIINVAPKADCITAHFAIWRFHRNLMVEEIAKY